MDEVSVDISAPPQRVWSLITDVTQMGKWSPECWSCTWLEGADGPAVGAQFKGRNKRGLMRWSTVSTVVSADAPDHFAFEVDNSGMRWGYRLHETGNTTRVTEYREKIGDQPWFVRAAYKARLLGRDPDAIVRSGMVETLDRLKAGAEVPAT
ncbi:MAG: SRPBCC family protein [Actinomycetota bacterium]|nr:SRPBCC family protein [Actinomycetota bacterium]